MAGYTDKEIEQISARMRLDLLRYMKMAGAGNNGGDLMPATRRGRF
jgi:hypothetical protein